VAWGDVALEERGAMIFGGGSIDLTGCLGLIGGLLLGVWYILSRDDP
jgi:hypothetical protein